MNNPSRQKSGRQIINPAKNAPVSKNVVNSMTKAEIWRRQFKADYEQIVKSISSAETGLRNGSPNPNVTH